eukprot:sb/3474044/
MFCLHTAPELSFVHPDSRVANIVCSIFTENAEKARSKWFVHDEIKEGVDYAVHRQHVIVEKIKKQTDLEPSSVHSEFNKGRDVTKNERAAHNRQHDRCFVHLPLPILLTPSAVLRDIPLAPPYNAPNPGVSYQDNNCRNEDEH